MVDAVGGRGMLVDEEEDGVGFSSTIDVKNERRGLIK